VALRVRRHPRAVADLDDIWFEIAADNRRAADRFAERVYEAESLLAEFPQLGEARPDLGPDLRKWTVGNYLVVYRVDAGFITVVRVLHGARDLPPLFEG
jgi:toxin ParE1/3/4